MHSAKYGLGKDQNRLSPSPVACVSVRRASFLLARRYALPGFDEFTVFG